jgi:hypothetical protein
MLQLLSIVNGKTWMQDELTDTEREELDYVIAMSLSEEELKGKKVIGKFHCLSVLTSTSLNCYLGRFSRILLKKIDDSVF